MQVCLQLLQVACKFSASCRGVRTSAIQLQYKKKILVSQLYCSCIALVRTALTVKVSQLTFVCFYFHQVVCVPQYIWVMRGILL